MSKPLEQRILGPVRMAPRFTTFSCLVHDSMEQVRRDNDALDSCLRLLAHCAARDANDATFMVAPESLGKCFFAAHASIWPLKELRHTASKFDPRRMTRVLASHRLPPQTSALGWPKPDWTADGKDAGPLGPHCHCGRRHISRLRQRGEYKAPERSLSAAAPSLLAAAAANAMAEEATSISTQAESLLRKGFDAFGALRNNDWIPETTVPADQTEDEDDLPPPSSESLGELTENELDGQQHASRSHKRPTSVERVEVRHIIQYRSFC